jgi:hypothetical protein
MIVSINQPCYLPWLGYFDRIARSDLHIVLDHVQFEKNSFTNRNKIRTAQGWTWLTIPVLTSGKFGALPIAELAMASPEWRGKHWNTLRQAYGKAPYFKQHAPYLEAIYARDWPLLAPLMREMTRYFLEALGIATPLKFSSEMAAQGTKADLVLNLCKDVGATTYLSGPLGRDYLEPEAFVAAGIGLSFQDYAHPTYRQAYPGFEAYMAALDLLLNHGPASLGLLKGEITQP